MVTGCDISHWQGKRIDFDKMKSAGAEFVFIKATDFKVRGGVDENFYRNVENAKEAELLVGAYHWWLSDSKFGVTEQAALFHSVVGDLCDLPPVLDVEVGGNPKELWTARLFAMIYQVEDYFNRTPIIYTSNGIWKNNAINYGWAKDYPLWLAQYKVSVPSVPSPWAKWNFWQYSATFTDPIAKNSENFGINKYEGKALDLNLFNGTLKELKAL